MSFGVTYGGEPVLLDHNSRLQRYFETRWPDTDWLFQRMPMRGHASPYWSTGHTSRIDTPYPRLPSVRIGELVWPTGASRYARGLYVVDKERMRAIASGAFGYGGDLTSAPVVWGNSWNALDLTFRQDGVTKTYSMYALPPLRLDTTDEITLWLLPLVDERYFWQLQGYTGADIGTTWTSLTDAIEGVLGVSGNFSAAGDYGTFDQDTFADTSISCGAALDLASLSTGQRVVTNESGGAVIYETAGAAAATRSNNFGLDGLRMGAVSPEIVEPEPIDFFARYVNDHYPHPHEKYVLTAGGTNSGSSPESPTVRCAWYVEHFQQAVDAGADAAFQDFADRFYADALAWNSRPYVASFAGIADWNASGFDDYVSIRIHDDIGGAAAIMRAVSLPQNFLPAYNACQRPNIYIHPHDTATGTLLDPLSGESTAELVFDEVESLYDSLPANVDVRLSKANPGLSLEAGETVFLHYQNGLGWCVVEGSGSSCNTIHFEVVEADVSQSLLIVRIIARPCGCTISPEQDSDEQVNVYDLLGCHLDDESDADLVDRRGTAEYVEVDDSEAAALGLDLDSDELTTCLWSLTGLCCPPDEVS